MDQMKKKSRKWISTQENLEIQKKSKKKKPNWMQISDFGMGRLVKQGTPNKNKSPLRNTCELGCRLNKCL